MAIVEWRLDNPPAFAVNWGVSFANLQDNIISGPTVGPIEQVLILNIPDGSIGHFHIGVFNADATEQEFRTLPPTGAVEVAGDAFNIFDFGGGGGAGGGFGGGIGVLILLGVAAFALTGGGKKRARR